MSAPRHYHQTVRCCADCPLLGPSIGSKRIVCGASGSRIIRRGIPHFRLIPDIDQIPEWCPLPASPSCPRCGAPGAHIGETPLPDGNGSYDQFQCSSCEHGHMVRARDHRWKNLAESITGGAP